MTATDSTHPYGTAGSPVSEDHGHAATLRRLQDAALLESEACEANGLPRLAAFARGQSDAFRIALLVLEGRSW